MRIRPFFITVTAVIALGLMATGCSTDKAELPVKPSADKPTFLYFYSDG